MDKEKLIVAQEELKAKLQEIAVSGATGNSMELARLANMPYDAEFPIPEVVSAIAKTATVAKGEDYEYFVHDVEVKTVYTVVDGTIIQVNVTPGSETDLVFSTYESPEYYVYVEKLLEAKYEPIAIKTKVAMESLNRKEIKDVLALVIASAESKSNTFANDSGYSVIDIKERDEGWSFVIKAKDKDGSVQEFMFSDDAGIFKGNHGWGRWKEVPGVTPWYKDKEFNEKVKEMTKK